MTVVLYSFLEGRYLFFYMNIDRKRLGRESQDSERQTRGFILRTKGKDSFAETLFLLFGCTFGVSKFAKDLFDGILETGYYFVWCTWMSGNQARTQMNRSVIWHT